MAGGDPRFGTLTTYMTTIIPGYPHLASQTRRHDAKSYDLHDYSSTRLSAQFTRSRRNRRVDQRLIRGNFGLGVMRRLGRLAWVRGGARPGRSRVWASG